MAYIILPSRRTRQPQGATRIDWSNPLAADLGGLWTFNDNSIRNLVTGEVGQYSNCSFVATKNGIALAATSDISYATLAADWRTVFGANAGTVAVWCEKRDSTFRAARIISANVSPAEFIVQTYTNGTTLYQNWPGGFSTNIATAVTGEKVYVSSIGSNAKLYSNGSLINTTAGTTYIGGGSAVELRLGEDVSVDGAERLNYYVVATWKKQLSDVEVYAFSKNPWQLFAPDPRRLYFGASGGGATTTTINAETGAFALTGAAATLNRGLVPLDAQPTSYAVSGIAATLARGWNLDAQPGTFTVSGTAATLARGWNLDAQPSTFAVSGTDATLARGWNLDAQPGAFELTGIAATLEYVQPGATTLDGQPGVFAVSGAAATLTYVQLTHYVIDAQPGTFTLTGIAGTLTYNQLNAYEITASPGAFAVTGSDAALTYTLASIWTDINPASSIWTDIDPNTIWTGL